MRRGPTAATKSHPSGLTRREVEVLDLIVIGLTNPQIADRLFLSRKTIEHHVTSILTKMGASTRTEAVRLAAVLTEQEPEAAPTSPA